jgi:putative Holliday junction resolvase
MNLIGVDYGRSRTGLALAREGLVMPLEPLPSGQWKEIASSLATLVEEHDAELVVLGLPLNASGGETELSEEVRNLREYLEQRGLAVRLCPEAGSTEEALQLLRDIGPDGSARLKDSVAAAVILERFLASL